MRIVKCEIVYGGKWEVDSVYAEFEDGTRKKLFTFFSDEINFSEDEFIGLTEEEAGKLRFNKDVAYLRS